MKRLRLIVSPAEEGSPVSQLLSARGGLSPTEIEQALQAGGVSVNRQRVFHGELVLQHQDELVVFLEERGRRALGPPPLGSDGVLLLRPDWVAVNKPAGIPSQGTPVDMQAGIDAALSALLKARGERNTSISLVHRLDLQTSGVMVLGRTREATRHLSREVREGRFEKRYLALVQGHPTWETQEVDAPLGPSRNRRAARAVRPGGESACTTFWCLKRYGEGETALSLLEVQPHTGRTHQIRVHAAHLRHPLAGDRLYGGAAFLTREDGERIDFPAFFLHASQLGFRDLQGRLRELKAPPPLAFSALLDTLASWTAEGK